LKGIADTGFLVAFGNRNDQHHEWAVELARHVREPLLTCDAVLAEAAFHLDSSAAVLGFVRDGLVRPGFDVATNIARLSALAERYADRKPDLADLCLIRMSELYPAYPVITVDLTDFRIYRRSRRDAIPLIHPPIRRR
jgi:predicted nucleic acid-binding protein